MDPLDPLTEVINSGQAFSTAINIERFVWLMIGIFFLGAISTSVRNSIKYQDLFSKKNYLTNLKVTKKKDKTSNELNDNKD